MGFIYLNDLIEIGESLHSIYEDIHTKQEKVFKCGTVSRCINLIARASTYKFRHELLHMSLEDCKKISEREFKQIVLVLETSADKLSTESFRNIMDFIDPPSKEEIHQIIGEYVIKDHRSHYRYSTFIEARHLINLIGEINKEKIDFFGLINLLAARIHFHDENKWKKSLNIQDEPYSLAGKNSKLGIKNPCILSLIKDNMEKNPNEILDAYDLIFSDKPLLNLYGGRPYEPLLEKVLILLMRWKIKNNTDNIDNKQAIEIIVKLSFSPEMKILFNNMLKLNEKLTHVEEFLKQKFDDYPVQKPNPINESLSEINDVIKKIDSIFIPKNAIILEDKIIDEILKGALSEESLVEKINILFSPEQPLLVLNKTFKNLIGKSLVKSYFSDTFSSSLDSSIIFWISTLAFVAYERELNQIKSQATKVKFENHWKKSRILSSLIEIESFFPKTD